MTCLKEILSRVAKFSTIIELAWPFGTVTIVRSAVRTRVDRIPMSSMTPTVSPIRQRSPTRMG